MLCSYKGGRVKNRTCAISSPRVEDIYTQGIGGESVDKGEEEVSNEEEIFHYFAYLYYARLLGELMVYTPHSGNYIPPGVLQFCQVKY